MPCPQLPKFLTLPKTFNLQPSLQGSDGFGQHLCWNKDIISVPIGATSLEQPFNTERNGIAHHVDNANTGTFANFSGTVNTAIMPVRQDG